ncbi:MAG: restriction endonuclease subunit S [Sedimentibacter sp.]|uniref:restriction endonuclease subunit S n=1 Tax=Sedimentibacter sp. TaxID=1960295 RepID=UPI00315833D0
MFGDTQTNSKGWEILSWKDVFNTTTGKLDSNAMVEGGKYPFFTCAKESFLINEFAFDCEALLLAGNNAAGKYDVKYYNGKFNAYQRTYVLTIVNNNWKYEIFKLQLEDKLLYLQQQSKGTNTRYLTMGILNGLNFINPPIYLQTQFADFIQQVDKQKFASENIKNDLKLITER